MERGLRRLGGGEVNLRRHWAWGRLLSAAARVGLKSGTVGFEDLCEVVKLKGGYMGRDL